MVYSGRLSKTTPRRKWPATVEQSRHGGGVWHRVYPPRDFERRPPVQHGVHTAGFDNFRNGHFPEMGVVELVHARVIGSAGWVMAENRGILYEQSWTAQNLRPAHLPQGEVQFHQVRGVCATLATEWAGINYAHFLLDCLGRLHLLEQAGFSLDRLDHLILPKPQTEGARLLVAQLNFPEHKILYTADDVVYEPEGLLSPSFPGLPRNYALWLPAYLRRRFGVSGRAGGRRLYLYRSDQYRRRLINESDILRHLTPLGFEVYDPVGRPDTARDFAEASLVVSVHAAALSNLVFCPNNTRILELIPSDHRQPYFYNLADSAGLDYGCLVGPSVQQRPVGSAGPSPFDFTVDEAEFIQAVRWLVEGGHLENPSLDS